MCCIPSGRPVVWKRTSNDDYDPQRVGLSVHESDFVPAAIDHAERRRFFDTRQFGKSAGGHQFPASLDEQQREAVLEYLKTL